VVASVGAKGASGGYYIAVASNFIYAEPNSQLGNIGAWVRLPSPEELDEETVTTGPFKTTGGSRRKSLSRLEVLRQEFIEAVVCQRGDRLNLSEEELSRGETYSGIESLRYGLIDDIGTRTAAIERAASLARVRNYEVVELDKEEPAEGSFGPSDLESLKAETGLMPTYYYLYFESE
jgi:protease-4